MLLRSAFLPPQFAAHRLAEEGGQHIMSWKKAMDPFRPLDDFARRFMSGPRDWPFRLDIWEKTDGEKDLAEKLAVSRAANIWLDRPEGRRVPNVTDSALATRPCKLRIVSEKKR